jgi:parallel beta-helix repeat protein
MARLTMVRQLALVLALCALSDVAAAVTLRVNCGQKEGLTTIDAALKALSHEEEISASKRIVVSGACNENVVIQSVDRLTLSAVNGASINDSSGGNRPTIFIGDSRDVVVSGFTINGGSDGIRCFDGSICRLNNNTVQNSREAGIFVLTSSYAVINGGLIQGNTQYAGIAVINGARALVSQASIRDNYYGALVNTNSFLNFLSSSSSANLGPGLRVIQGSSAVCGSCTISSNGADGVEVAENSNLVLTLDFGVPNPPGHSITGNNGAGVSLTNLSGVSMPTAGNVSGNAGIFDITCNPSFTSASNLANAGLSPGRTNCVGP